MTPELPMDGPPVLFVKSLEMNFGMDWWALLYDTGD